MVVALLRWMIAEGEDPNNITIIGAYRGQVSLLRKELETCQGAENVQVHTIDRFQGSENKTVVVSLVRSNEDGDIGFLAKRNRLCVSVSRARGALYFCGSSDTFAAKSPHWKTLVNYFQEQNCLGEQIFMRCPRHPFDPPFTICSSEVNSFHPLLCERSCRDILNCNHQCQGTCHHGEHPECRLTVQFLFKDCGHEATKECSQKEETILCEQDITYTFEACQHTEVLKCWRVIKKIGLNCMQVCPKKLECGHPCTLKCYQNCKANPCSICLKIEKEKVAKEKLREQEELKLKLKELENEIERLKNAKEETSLKELDSEGETAAEYFQIRDRTEKYIQPKHGIFPIVTKIEKVRNPKLQLKFVETQRDLIWPMAPTQLLFHGTSDDGIQGIVEKGFQLPSVDKRNMFGQGIYFATDSSKSAQKIYTKGSNKLLLCEVLLGRTLMVQRAQADLNKMKINKKGYDSLFSKREGIATGGTMYDEFVVYDPYQAITRYIVHYKNLSVDPAAMPPSPISADQNLTRIQYKMSPNFTEDSPAEYHFRLAESQFFRMSSRMEYKVVMVELIINKTLQKQFEKAKEEFEQKKINFTERLVFHGTDMKAIEKIIEEGFKIGGEGVEVRNGAVYGKGVYTAVDPIISVPYSKGGKMMLLSIALLDDQGKEHSQGHSSDVLVMKRAEHLLPKYIVHYTER